MIRVLLLACALLAIPGVLTGQSGDRSPRVPVAPDRYEGTPIRLVYIDLRDTSGVEYPDSAMRAAIERAIGLRAGGTFNVASADVALQQLLKVQGVVSARWALYESSMAGEVVLAFMVVGDPSAGIPAARGWLVTGNPGEFPTLLETGRSLLRVQLNGGLGWFNDINCWFGDPDAFVGGSSLFPDPAGEGLASWGEGYVEIGMHGALQLAEPRLFAFGNVTLTAAGSAGQDPWRSDLRGKTEIEKAYAGLLYVTDDNDFAVTASYGSQVWQLNKGFLFSQYAGSFNAAQWGASYLAARTALQQAFLARVRWRRLSLEAFLVDPQEYPLRDSGTEYSGLNLQYKDGRTLELGAVYYEVPESGSSFLLPDGSQVPREGLRTTNLRVATDMFGIVPGVLLESELAHQSNKNYDMSADAWYVSAGYEFGEWEWTPSITYRYAFFEGDDPATTAYERFDAPQSSGSDNWLQGNVFKKTVVNSNLRSHRVRFAVKPSQQVGLILNYFYLWADGLNNRGGARPLQVLSDRAFGHEVDLALNWAVSRRLFILGFAGIAVPGAAIEQALVNGAKSWGSIQLSLFWSV
jgi:hypothetical protein